MGKRRGAAIRAKKRADAAAKELLEQKVEQQESARYESKLDTELFVLDKTPDAAIVNSIANKRRKIEEKAARSVTAKIVQKSKKHRISDKDERQIRKLMTTHSPQTVIEIAKAKQIRLDQRKKAKRTAGTAKANFDLWDDGNDTTAAAAIAVGANVKNGTKVIPVTSGRRSMAGTAPLDFIPVTNSSLRKDIQQPSQISNKLKKARAALRTNARKKVSVEVAQPGQSYRPDEEQHQDVIGEALGIELRRQEALDYRKAPIGGGQLNDETLALLVGDSDTDDDDDDDDNDENAGENTNVHKKEDKLTRAQRNKQKRVRAQEHELAERKKSKKLLSSINDSKSLVKDLRKEEAIQQAKRKELNALKEETKSKPIGINVIENLAKADPLNAPALPVALTEELKGNGGSLRAVKPKGSLLTDRLESMASRSMVNKKKAHKKNVVEGKRRKMKPGKGRDFLLV